MAANPLPRPRKTMADFTVDASKVTGNIPSTGYAVANNTIAWKLTATEPETTIQVSAVDGHFPFIGENSFPVAPGTTHTSTVAPNAPNNSYPYGRNGGAAVGHIIVGPGGMPKPTRAK
jgi:hypothetical protein